MNDNDKEPKIHPTARVDDSVELGDWTVVHKYAEIHGDVKIGRAGWILPYAIVGGGQQELGSLRAGDFLHMGMRSFINIADFVTIGQEVGLGMETKIFSHGGYLNEIDGFPFQRGPVHIGNNVWLPYATVLPNVRIKDNVVVSAMSLVNKDLPEGCLAGGIPVRIIKEDVYPKKHKTNVSSFASFLNRIRQEALTYGSRAIITDELTIRVGKTTFFPKSRIIIGPVNKDTERVKDIFRRHGVRFRYYDNGGEYVEWD